VPKRRPPQNEGKPSLLLCEALDGAPGGDDPVVAHEHTPGGKESCRTSKVITVAPSISTPSTRWRARGCRAHGRDECERAGHVRDEQDTSRRRQSEAGRTLGTSWSIWPCLVGRRSERLLERQKPALGKCEPAQVFGDAQRALLRTPRPRRRGPSHRASLPRKAARSLSETSQYQIPYIFVSRSDPPSLAREWTSSSR
jgi:hypothetical protein